MGKKEAYEAALSMYQREHPRWVQNALFLLGALASILLVSDRLDALVPMWTLTALAAFVSTLMVLVALSIRASTDAWLQTVKEIEATNREFYEPFSMFQIILRQHSYSADMASLFCIWKRTTLFSVTRMYTLFSLLLSFCLWGFAFHLLFSASPTDCLPVSQVTAQANHLSSRCLTVPPTHTSQVTPLDSAKVCGEENAPSRAR